MLVNDRWFLTPDSFVKLLHNGILPDESISQYQDRILGDETVKFLETVQSWMRQWATEGHSPVVHRNLYSGGYMPQYVEDAFTVLATYHSSSNPQIRKTALQIAGRRAGKLIASFLVPEFQLQEPPEMCQSILIDTQTHLARTLALLTYQTIGLLDPDIRARSNAEEHIETLNSWATQMLESARLDSLTADIEAGTPSTGPDSASPETIDPAQGQIQTTPFEEIVENACPGTVSIPFINIDEFLSFPNVPPTTNSSSPPISHRSAAVASHRNPFVLPPKPSSTSPPSATQHHHHVTSLHRAWLIAESVRRVWLTATYTQFVYMVLKLGAGTNCPSSESPGCPGGMTFTARAGLWDAPSGYPWFELVKRAVGATQDGDGIEGNENEDKITGEGKEKEKGLSMLMLKTNEAWKVLEGLVPARPRDVDEFTRAILLICFGKGWIMERWLDLDKDDVGEEMGGKG